jgi:RNA recognition motif-containing protein
MSVKLFVGGLSFSTTSEGLRTAFARFGQVASAMVMTDRATGRSRGFGFVEMMTTEEAERAIGGMNGAVLDGRTIRVDRATPRGTPAPRRPAGPSPSGAAPAPRRPAGFGPPGGGPPAWPDTRSRGGGGRGGKRREGEGERRGPSRGRPTRERRAGDKGRRGDEMGYRW